MILKSSGLTTVAYISSFYVLILLFTIPHHSVSLPIYLLISMSYSGLIHECSNTHILHKRPQNQVTSAAEQLQSIERFIEKGTKSKMINFVYQLQASQKNVLIIANA